MRWRHDEVAVLHGLTRLGPRRQRLSRREWLDQKRQARALADMRQGMKERAADLRRAAEHFITARTAEVQIKATAEVATVKASAEQRLANVKSRARMIIETMEREKRQLQEHVWKQEAVIADQTAVISQLEEILTQNGIDIDGAKPGM